MVSKGPPDHSGQLWFQLWQEDVTKCSLMVTLRSSQKRGAGRKRQEELSRGESLG